MSNTEIENLKDPQEYRYGARFAELKDMIAWASEIPPSPLRTDIETSMHELWGAELEPWIAPPNNALHTLVENWQSNGNSRALDDPKSEVWHRCARELLDALEADSAPVVTSPESRALLPVHSMSGKVLHTPLVDDLADVLIRMVVMGPLEHHPEVRRVTARYRVSKGRKA